MANRPVADGLETDLDIRQRLAAAFARPEPMCLALVRAEMPAVGATADPTRLDDELIGEFEQRLRRLLRSYDELAATDETTFMAVLRTLAGSADLDSRMRHVYEELSRPYAVGRSTVRLAITLGAVVREPSERPADLIRRAEWALAEAHATGSAAPILL